MKKRLGFGTLQSRIYTIFTVMLFAAIFIMQIVSFRYTIQTVRNSVLANNKALLGQLTSQIDSYISGMEQLAARIVDDEEIQQYLSMDEPFVQESGSRIEVRLQNYLQAREDISGIFIFSRDGRSMSSEPQAGLNPWIDIKKQHWYKDAVAAMGRTVVSTSYVQNIVEGKYSWVVSLSRAVISSTTGDFIGVLLLDLKFNRINELCKSLVVGERSYDFILDDQGNYVFHPMQQLVYSDIRTEPIREVLSLAGFTDEDLYFDGEHYFTVDTSALTGWHIVNVTYRHDITTDWRYVQLSYSAIGLVLFIFTGLATNIISSGMTKPIRKLQDIMKSVEYGEFHRVGRIEGTDEIRELAREYDIMVTRISELVEENTREQELKRKSDLKALQAQINPHFLYNTLDSIIWMGEMGQNREVVQMTSALSKLFRISISKGREIISIAEEIAHVQSYLTIQEMRYRDKFRYLIDIDPSIHDLSILKITLQPLVENAIYHGIKEVDHEGFIRISGHRTDDEVFLEVTDNGRGMSTAELEKLKAGVFSYRESGKDLNRQGLGVRNVHERINLYFGKKYGLSIESSQGKGTKISVCFPAEEKETAG